MNILASLSRDFMLSEAVLLNIIRSAPHRYKVYPIDKKEGGGKRIIAQPARQVKALQYWVIDHVLKGLPIHRAAMAYRTGRSIRENADKHASQRFLLKLDFQDFFHSIKEKDIEVYFATNKKRELTSEDINYLKRILFWKPKGTNKLVMSIGAPSSPILSNILLFDFDKKVQAICTKKKVRYTRYADDLTFSTNRPNVLREIELQVDQLCRNMMHPKVRIKREKTVHASRGGLRKVTGLILSNEGVPSLGRDRKRLIRAQVHRFLSGSVKPEDALKLCGMLAFVNSAEPDFLERLISHYGGDAISRIRSLRRG